VTPMLHLMQHFQDVVKLHSFVLGHLRAFLLSFFDWIFALL